MPTPALEIAGIVVSALASSGALLFFFRYGVRLALVEKAASEAKDDSKQNGKDIAATKERVSLVENTLLDIRNSLSKLNNIDTIMVTVSTLKEQMVEHFKDHVPRNEQNARWTAQAESMANLQSQVSELRETLLR